MTQSPSPSAAALEADLKAERDIRDYIRSHTSVLARHPNGWGTDRIEALLRLLDHERAVLDAFATLVVTAVLIRLTPNGATYR